ncbi:hypothetical protein FB451DRAFT_1372981 [Mycena latifolia]|nr:hypothetical protein FB451DRAFT_1372981 [Mycena latifolia]
MCASCEEDEEERMMGKATEELSAKGPSPTRSPGTARGWRSSYARRIKITKGGQDGRERFATGKDGTYRLATGGPQASSDASTVCDSAFATPGGGAASMIVSTAEELDFQLDPELFIRAYADKFVRVRRIRARCQRASVQARGASYISDIYAGLPLLGCRPAHQATASSASNLGIPRLGRKYSSFNQIFTEEIMDPGVAGTSRSSTSENPVIYPSPDGMQASVGIPTPVRARAIQCRGLSHHVLRIVAAKFNSNHVCSTQAGAVSLMGCFFPGELEPPGPMRRNVGRSVGRSTRAGVIRVFPTLFSLAFWLKPL